MIPVLQRGDDRFATGTPFVVCQSRNKPGSPFAYSVSRPRGDRLIWSNAWIEGQITKRKFVKRPVADRSIFFKPG